MGTCKLDHTKDDVKSKFDTQIQFLPEEISSLFKEFFEEEHSQDILNTVFHLLKKYDLSSEEEKTTRNQKIIELLKK